MDRETIALFTVLDYCCIDIAVEYIITLTPLLLPSPLTKLTIVTPLRHTVIDITNKVEFFDRVD